MKRSRATKLLDDIRVMLAKGNTAEELSRFIAKQYGIEPLQPCSGEAHSNLHVDNCSVCNPRWGVVGEKIQIT